jgi:hypothetical protein
MSGCTGQCSTIEVKIEVNLPGKDNGLEKMPQGEKRNRAMIHPVYRKLTALVAQAVRLKKIIIPVIVTVSRPSPAIQPI